MHMRRALHDDGSEGRRQEWNQAPKPEQAVAPAAEVSNSTADQPCLGTPWTTDCFTHKHVAGGDAGSGQGNFGVAAVAGQQGSPVSTTVLALTMTCVGILAVVSVIGAYYTIRQRQRRQRQRALARSNQEPGGLPKEGPPREVTIPVLVLGPDNSTMLAFDEDSIFNRESCDSASSCSTYGGHCGSTTSNTPPRAVPLPISGDAAANQPHEHQQQQRRWWQRWHPAAVAATVPAATSDASTGASTNGSGLPPLSSSALPSSSHEQRYVSVINAEAHLSASSSGTSEAGSEAGASGHSLVRRVWYPAHRSVLAVADVRAMHAQAPHQLTPCTAAGGMPGTSVCSVDG